MTKNLEKDYIKLPSGIYVAKQITLLDKDWFDDYVEPALQRGITVAIDTNGYFMGSGGYATLLENGMSV